MDAKRYPTREANIRLIRRRLRAEKARIRLELIGLSFTRLRIRLLLFLFKTPDYLTALLLAVFGRAHKRNS